MQKLRASRWGSPRRDSISRTTRASSCYCTCTGTYRQRNLRSCLFYSLWAVTCAWTCARSRAGTCHCWCTGTCTSAYAYSCTCSGTFRVHNPRICLCCSLWALTCASTSARTRAGTYHCWCTGTCTRACARARVGTCTGTSAHGWRGRDDFTFAKRG
jgi:hypothetical protein